MQAFMISPCYEEMAEFADNITEEKEKVGTDHDSL